MSIVANVVVDSFVFPMGATGRQRVISYGSSLRSITRQEKAGSRQVSRVIRACFASFAICVTTAIDRCRLSENFCLEIMQTLFRSLKRLFD